MSNARKFQIRIVVAIVAVMSVFAAAASGIGDLFNDAPIVQAARKGSVEETNAALIAGEPVNKRSAQGTPVLVLAVEARSLDVVKLLIDNGARPDIDAKDGTTALTLAASNGDGEIAAYLLDHKADIDLPGALRETALIKATRNKHKEVVKLLLDRGAALDETDASGATALDIAERNNAPDIAALLKKKASSK